MLGLCLCLRCFSGSCFGGEVQRRSRCHRKHEPSPSNDVLRARYARLHGKSMFLLAPLLRLLARPRGKSVLLLAAIIAASGPAQRPTGGASVTGGKAPLCQSRSESSEGSIARQVQRLRYCYQGPGGYLSPWVRGIREPARIYILDGR